MTCIGVILLGQAYQRGFRLSQGGPWGPLAEAINQTMIFSPVGMLLLFRGHGLSTIWLPTERVLLRLGIGVGIAWAALFAFAISRSGADNWLGLCRQIYTWEHFDEAVQVFFEDIAIAMLMVRFTTALGRSWLAACIVGFLFAAGHVPAMLEAGIHGPDFFRLVMDFGLATGMLLVLQRSMEITWFWLVHFSLDMTQFAENVG